MYAAQSNVIFLMVQFFIQKRLLLSFFDHFDYLGSLELITSDFPYQTPVTINNACRTFITSGQKYIHCSVDFFYRFQHDYELNIQMYLFTLKLLASFID